MVTDSGQLSASARVDYRKIKFVSLTAINFSVVAFLPHRMRYARLLLVPVKLIHSRSNLFALLVRVQDSADFYSHGAPWANHSITRLCSLGSILGPEKRISVASFRTSSRAIQRLCFSQYVLVVCETYSSQVTVPYAVRREYRGARLGTCTSAALRAPVDFVGKQI